MFLEALLENEDVPIHYQTTIEKINWEIFLKFMIPIDKPRVIEGFILKEEYFVPCINIVIISKSDFINNFKCIYRGFSFLED